MAYRLIQICDRCKTQVDTSVKIQNYEHCHEITASSKDSYSVPRRTGLKWDLCLQCEELLFVNFIKNQPIFSTPLPPT